VAERLAEEVDAAALPGAAEHLRDRLLQASVRVGDDQLPAAEATRDQRAQEAAPERPPRRRRVRSLAVAGLVHAVGEHERLAHDTARVADLLDLGIEPQVGVAVFKRPVAEGVDLLVEILTDPRDLALRDPQPERLDHLVDLALCVSRSGVRSPRSAPISSETSTSISCCTTQLSDSRKKSSPSPSSR
jgi:hypothetical protein